MNHYSFLHSKIVKDSSKSTMFWKNCPWGLWPGWLFLHHFLHFFILICWFLVKLFTASFSILVRFDGASYFWFSYPCIELVYNHKLCSYGVFLQWGRILVCATGKVMNQLTQRSFLVFCWSGNVVGLIFSWNSIGQWSWFLNWNPHQTLVQPYSLTGQERKKWAYQVTCPELGEDTMTPPNHLMPMPNVDKDKGLFATTLTQWLWGSAGRKLMGIWKPLKK